MKVEEKRKTFLNKLDKKYRKWRKFNKYIGPGIKKKILRLFFAPSIYIPYILRKTGLCKDKIKRINLFWGKRIYIRTCDLDSFSLMNTGILSSDPEVKLTKFFIKNLKANDVFYDIGANYGFYTYLALEFVKEVHSFEPLPFVFKCLELTLKDTPNVFLNNLALSDKEGELEMFIPTLHSGGSTLLKVKGNKIKKLNKIIRVKTITLDDYLASGKSKPTIIKLDVEGAESLVIDGGIRFLKNNNPIIAMEVWSKDEGYDISRKAVEKLKKLGYQPYFILSNGEIKKVEGELSIIIKKSFENFIFLKGSSK